MNRLEATLLSVVGRLEGLDVGCALVGGLAVSARAEPRFTRDVDLVAAVADDRAAEALIRQLVADGFQVMATVEQETVGRLATVRLLPPGEAEEGVLVDLLFASSGVEDEIVRAAERVEIFPGASVPLATLGHLIALKLLARDEDRPQDDADLRALLRGATTDDFAVARKALELVVERGFARGRDLMGALDEAVARWGC